MSRPCYQQLRDANCEAKIWTSERYSAEVVASLAAAIREAAGDGTREIVLVGYSGGGVLAVLVAEQLVNVSAVVTIAANLDTEAWAAHHGYLPLTGSLNPALSTREHAWREVHLQGTEDGVVPIATTARYFTRYPSARALQFEGFSHVCCWVERWEEIFAEAQRSEPRARSATSGKSENTPSMPSS